MKRTLAIGLLCLPIVVQAADVCRTNNIEAVEYGPWDYTDPGHRADKIPVVERHHFTAQVRELRGGESGYIGSDIDYTLRRVPNHHQALYAMTRLALRNNTTKPERMGHTVGCWFERAAAFAPNDGVVHMIHGMYLAEKGDVSRGIERMEAGVELEPGNANIHYNLGLLYYRSARFEQAREHARKAYSQGFPLPGLREMLRSAGEWSAPSR